MKRKWFALVLENGDSIDVLVSPSHKNTYKAIAQLKQNSRVVSVKRIAEPSDTASLTEEVLAISHINRKNEASRPVGSKDKIQLFIDKFRDTPEAWINFELYSYQTYELGQNGSGALLATRKI